MRMINNIKLCSLLCIIIIIICLHGEVVLLVDGRGGVSMPRPTKGGGKGRGGGGGGNSKPQLLGGGGGGDSQPQLGGEGGGGGGGNSQPQLGGGTGDEKVIPQIEGGGGIKAGIKTGGGNTAGRGGGNGGGGGGNGGGGNSGGGGNGGGGSGGGGGGAKSSGGGGGGGNSGGGGNGGGGSSGGGGGGGGKQTSKKGGGGGGGGGAGGGGGGAGTINVKSYRARADGRNDDSQAFQTAWKTVCAATTPSTMFIPKGTYLVGPLKFTGPCKAPITVQMQGYLKASTDLNRYGQSADWIEFGWVDGLTLTGGGTFDGQGASSWPFNKCPTNQNCKVLPTNVKFVSTTNTVVKGLTSLNSKFFHMVLLGCKDFKASGIRISAPANSPNTDGIHIERSSGVTISNAVIGTGDDCVSIGQGNSEITITGITCGPGHGISVGSLGKYPNEGDVNGLLVKGCTMTGTMNGIRIKTWANSPDASAATNMTFEDIVVNNVANPIIIDQTYCPFASCSSQAPSRVKLSDIFFRNIRGTTSSPVAVTLECSKGMPCENVHLEDVHLDPSSGGSVPRASCQHVTAKYTGTQIPPPCE